MKKSVTIMVTLGIIIIISLAVQNLVQWDNKDVNENMKDKLFGKNKESPTTIHPDVGAMLKKINGFPDIERTPASDSLNDCCIKVRIEGVPPDARLIDDPVAQIPRAGFIVRGINGEELALLNDPEAFSFDIWRLSYDRKNPTTKVKTGKISEDQSAWVGFHVTGATSLPGKLVLLSVNRYTPRQSPALFLFDVRNSTYKFLASVDPDIRNPLRYFDTRVISPSATMAVFYSGRTRLAAEIYYNRYNHLMLFTKQYPYGIEVMKLGIDTGNVQDWYVRNRTLYLYSLDGRDNNNAREGYWALDLSQLLDG